MHRSSSTFVLACFGSAALLAACGGGGGGGLATDPETDPATNSPPGVTQEMSQVPLAGQILADCTESGQATLEGFFAADPLPIETFDDVPPLSNVLDTDPSSVPVIGGLAPSADEATDLVSITAEDTTAMLPDGAVSGELPVLGDLRVVCSGVSLPEEELVAPTDATGLVVVFDELGAPIGVLLATVENGAEGAPDVTEITLPVEDPTLPAEVGDVTETLLGLAPALPIPPVL